MQNHHLQEPAFLPDETAGNLKKQPIIFHFSRLNLQLLWRHWMKTGITQGILQKDGLRELLLTAGEKRADRKSFNKKTDPPAKGISDIDYSGNFEDFLNSRTRLSLSVSGTDQMNLTGIMNMDQGLVREEKITRI